jgi:hypothetical protein
MGKKSRADQEIIPPARNDRQSQSGTARIRVFADGDGVRQVYVARLGPWGVLLLALAIGILFAVILVLVVGAFLIWIPFVGLLIVTVIISGLLRGYFRRPS